ncbi:MAG: pilus assembly protein PilP [Gammaproteobacteria bacterium]|nr:MAG: pilus assembly protein PilP [Gammaproteobacteria bacterium]
MKQSGEQAMRVAAMALIMALTLTACSENMEDLNKYIVSVKERPADPIAPIPPVRTYTPYTYDGTVGRDPFRQSLSESSDDDRPSNQSGPRPDFERPKEYLERYELDSMSMVGTFRKGESYWALIRDPEGVVHRVPVGNYMGRNYGRVVLISDTQVYLSELISDGVGGWLVREASIALGEG